MGGSGVKKDAFANSGTAQNLSGTYGSRASNLFDQSSNLYSSLLPQFENEAVNPQGLGPTQKANMNTAAQQSTGGSTAGAVGQGALYAARTRNAGAGDAAIAQSARNAGENLSKATLNTELEDAALKERQRQSGLNGLNNLYGQTNNLYGTNVNAGLNALGLSNNALQVANGAKPTFWQQLGTGAANNLMNAGLDSLEAGAGF